MAKRIPIHTFPIKYEKESFRQMSQLTGGDYNDFPKGSREAADILSNVLGVNIMKIAEEKLRMENIQNPGLVNSFKHKFMEKRYC